VQQLKGGHETKQTLVQKTSEVCRLSPAGGAGIWSGDGGTFCISPCPPKDGIYCRSELPGRLLKTAHSCDSLGRKPCPAPTSALLTSLQVQRFIWVSCVNGTNFTNVLISQNHSMAWAEKDHKDHLVSTALPQAGVPTTRPGCPEPLT